MIYNPVQMARIMANAAMLKELLVKTGRKLTYTQFGEMIGIGSEAEWTQDHNEQLAMICQNLYDLEHYCGAYEVSTWDTITYGSGKSTWHWSGQSDWDWWKRRARWAQAVTKT